MSVAFLHPCEVCEEPITYVANRPVAHDCITEYNESENDE